MFDEDVLEVRFWKAEEAEEAAEEAVALRSSIVALSGVLVVVGCGMCVIAGSGSWLQLEVYNKAG